MNKELEALEKLTLKQKWDNFLDFVDAPAQARLLDCDCKEGLEQYQYLRTEIETTLKKIDKAINLIKEKNVDVYWLRKSPSLPRYNIAVGSEQRLLKKEYNLLKEIFE